MSNLSDLGPGESGVVVGWAGGVPSPRLLEMGILEGTEIEVLGAQAWMTGTGMELFEGLGGDAIHLSVSESFIRKRRP